MCWPSVPARRNTRSGTGCWILDAGRQPARSCARRAGACTCGAGRGRGTTSTRSPRRPPPATAATAATARRSAHGGGRRRRREQRSRRAGARRRCASRGGGWRRAAAAPSAASAASAAARRTRWTCASRSGRKEHGCACVVAREDLAASIKPPIGRGPEDGVAREDRATQPRRHSRWSHNTHVHVCRAPVEDSLLTASLLTVIDRH